MKHGRRSLPRLLARWAILALGLILGGTYALTAQPARVLNETFATDADPIQLNADHIATWTEAGCQVFLMKGNVAIQQGNTKVRTPDAVVWVDMDRYKKDQVFHAVVYADSGVNLERGGAEADAEHGYIRMATSNAVKSTTFQSEMVKRNLSQDAVYQRGVARTPAGLTLPLRKDEAALPRMDEMVRQVSALQPPPAPPEAPKFPAPTAPKIAPIPDNNMPPAVPPGIPPGVQPPSVPFTPPTPAVVPPARTMPMLSVRPRYQGDLQVRYEPSKTEPGVTAVIVSGGVSLAVSQPGGAPGTKVNFVDMEADRLVVWTRGNAQQLFNNMSTSQEGDSGAHEVYLAGHVQLFTRTDKSVEALRADEVYYDFRRGVAVARQADLEIMLPKVPMPVHAKTQEMIQVNPKLRQMREMSVYSSILPSDPGLQFTIKDATITTVEKERSYLWGLFPAYDKEGKRIVDTDNIFTGTNMFTILEGVPVFYFPYYRGRVEDPLGPLDGVNISYNNIFGFQLYTTWDIYDLLNLPRIEGTRSRLFLDYLSLRGPAFGTEFDFRGRDYFGINGNYLGMLKAYGVFDKKADVLGGNRGNVIYWPNLQSPNPIEHDNFRGIINGNLNIQEMDHGFSVLGQLGLISDRNFLEQYYLDSQLNDLNRDTYLRVKQQQDNWAWTLYGQVRVRDWLTETNWLPKADGYLLGKTFSLGGFDDLFVYNAHASAGYAQLLPTSVVPYPYFPTDVRTNTARLDLWQDVSLPFYLGPVKMAPYLAGDLTYYSEDVNGDQQGRLYGAAGVRWSMPMSRLYPTIQSELFNVDQIYHKISLTGNYYVAQSSTSFQNLPQLSRWNDDASDQALRDIRPWQPSLNPGAATFLTTSGLVNPQTYAIRRLIDTNPDTLDSINVLQLGVRQRWQTQRGFAGNQHTVDFVTLNVGISYFPSPNRDNFGQSWGILEYDWVWNIGDRTALTSSGWFEPWAGGPRAFDFGGIINRPDGTNLYLGYRQIDPLNAKAVIASVVFPFSAKYAVNANTVWDFGNNVRTYGVFVSRMGTDLMVNFGVNYNSTLNTFGVAFEMIPNLARRQGRFAGVFPSTPMDIAPVANQK